METGISLIERFHLLKGQNLMTKHKKKSINDEFEKSNFLNNKEICNRISIFLFNLNRDFFCSQMTRNYLLS